MQDKGSLRRGLRTTAVGHAIAVTAYCGPRPIWCAFANVWTHASLLFPCHISEWFINPLAANHNDQVEKACTNTGVAGVWLTRSPQSVKYA